MNRLPNIHPGEVLKEEFLVPLHLTAYRLAKETKMPQTRISEIIKGKRGITADTALRLAKFLGTTPQFWLGLQNDYDLEESEKNISKDLEDIHPVELVPVETQVEDHASY
jgi:addiction module HigA family antidote